VRRIAPVAFFLLLVVSAGSVTASADTIVLKNGRRIVADSVVETDDHVSYQTAAGELTLPRSMVERVEKDNFSPTYHHGDAPNLTSPHVEMPHSTGDVANAVVRDGSVDNGYLARLEGQARSGGAEDIARVTTAHYAAAQFLIAKGDFDHAGEHYRRALEFAPDNVPLLLNLAILRLRQSQFTAAIEPLERAKKISPDSPDVAKLLGWAYYDSNRLNDAVNEWQRSVKLKPDAEVTSALAKAQRDRDEETDYREGETAHFSVKYSGNANPDLARSILYALEQHYRDLESQLDYTPPEPVSVILYTNQAFADITRAPGWAGAVNDGRIRVPVQGLTSVTPELSRVLKHELTHSFVAQKTRGRAPTWLQEGLAQWMEGRRSAEYASSLVQTYDKSAAPSFSTMEGSWMSLSGDSVTYAYAWALAAVEEIISAGGMGDIERLLDRIATEPSTETALRDSTRMDYADLAQQTANYLRHEYTR
jgi:tetratricopeptide (TPR) repeat protein